MNAILKSPFAWLLRREYWESRRGFLWCQVWAAVVLLAITVLGIATLEIVGPRSGNGTLEMNGAAITIDNNTLVGSNLGGMLRNALTHNTALVVRSLDTTMLGFAMLGGIVLTFVVFFYLLGALYDDRRDRSVLFWKSLPLSDTATVVSKAIAAVVVAPLIMLGIVLAAYVADQIIISIWFAIRGLNPFTLIWAHAEPFSVWLHLLASVPLYAIWALPTVGWLLLWSAMVRSKPFLWAVVIPILAGALNSWIALLGIPHIDLEFFWSQIVARALLSVVPAGWVSIMQVAPDEITAAPEAIRHFGSYAQMGQVFLAPETWIGAIVGIALIAGAIWFRRWRDEV